MAGFAIAVFFAWKFSRPSLGFRRLKKHASNASASGASFWGGKDMDTVDDSHSVEKVEELF